MDAILNDFRVALRQLARRPAFAATAVLTLGIGIGVNAVAFTVVNGLLYNGFARQAAPGVGRIQTIPGGDEIGYASIDEYARFAEATRGTIDLEAEGRSSLAWRHDDNTEPAWVLFVSSKYFSMVTATMVAGQLQVAPASGGMPSVVIGERFWRQKLASRSIAGLTLRLNNVDVSIAGVIAESFTGPGGLYSPDVWLPLDDLALFRTSASLQKRDVRWLFLIGKLEEGATPARANVQVKAAADAMARDWPDTHKDRSARFKMLGESNSEVRGLSTAAAVAMGIISLILLLACFNVANLLLARAVERERDMGIRSALGATPSRLTRLVLTEGVVLAVLSGVAALLLAWWTQSLVGAFAIPIDEPQHVDLSLDSRVAAFVALLVAVTGVLPGVWPAIAAGRVSVARVLAAQGQQSAGGRPSPLRRWLVGAQIAGSTAFITIAALLIQSYSGVSRLDVGFARDQLVVAEVEPGAHGYDAERSERYIDALRSRIAALPGIADVAIADRAPFFIGYDRQTVAWPAAGPCGTECPKYATYAVSSGYFRTMGISMRQGREYSQPHERAVVVINEALAKKQWPDGGALGQTLRVGAEGSPLTVIGITGKTRTRGLDREMPALFLPLDRERFEGSLTIIARATGPASSVVRPIVDATHVLDPDVALQSAKTMEERMAAQLWPFRTLSWTFSICAALAVILATVGLVGVIAHAMSRRMREFAGRVSIGATRIDLVAEVINRRLTPSSLSTFPA
jgi:predicted permease